MSWEPIRRLFSRYLPGILILLVTLLTACSLPQVKAEDRLFLNLSLDFLSEYRLPKMDFQETKVGGLSAIFYDRKRDQYYAVSDDRSDFAPARFYTLKLALDTADPKAPKIKQVEITDVTTITDETGQPYARGSVDPEGIFLAPSDTLFISSEGVPSEGIAPFVREFDLKTGQWKRTLPLPERYTPDVAGKERTRGVQDNLGFESLTIGAGSYGQREVEPFRVFTASESSLIQDQDPPEQGQKSRLLHYLVETGRSLLLSEHTYELEPKPEGSVSIGLVEMLSIDPAGHFLALERSFGGNGFGLKLYQLAMGGATDTSSIPSLKGTLKGVQPIRKKLLLDFSTLGIPLDNTEGITFGPRLPDGSQSLLFVSDDNFNQMQVTQFLLFRLKGLPK